MNLKPTCKHARWNTIAMLACVGLLALRASGLYAAPAIKADPATGAITVETDRYSARFTAGTLTYLHHKLSDRVMLDVSLNPAIATVLRTGLYVEDQPLADPFWIAPRMDGDVCSTPSVSSGSNGAVCVTFTGLARLDAGGTFYPEARLMMTVAVAPGSGDLLVQVTGISPKTPVVGSGFAYSGLMTRSFDYAAEHSGLRHSVDLNVKKRDASVLEWSNISHDKRTGLGGSLWHAPVTVQASAEDPAAAFSVWAEDDIPLYKFLVRNGKDNAYVTYSIPPYDDNRATTSVVWRVNVFNHGWAEAAAPFADSLARRGATQNRAPWAKDISLIVFMAGQGGGYLDALINTFPPECRSRIVLWLPQSWRTLTNTRDPKTHDAYYWDNNYSEQTAAWIKAATAAGFRVSVYTNPHYNWGSADMVIDPEIRKVVAGFAENPLLDTVSRRTLKYGANNIAYTPYREHMLNTFRHILDNLDVSLYLDTTHQFMLDGRGRIDGLTSYDGAIKLFKGVRAIKKDQFLGTEEINELAVMAGGCDYSLFFDLHWAKGWEEQKARATHPIVSYLYRDTSVQVSQRVNPWAYDGARYYHLAEEISERIGTIATTEWIHQGKPPVLETPEQKHWLEKIRLFALRGLRPVFPAVWEPQVMSYLKAADGTLFVYEETDYGSRLVERTPKGPVVHSGRVWKQNAFKTADGQMQEWIGRADDGTWIGLDNISGFYVLSPNAGSDARLRVRSLTKGICLRNVKVSDSLATLELAPVATNAAPASALMGFVASKPVVRVAVPGQPRVPVNEAHEVVLTLNMPVAFIWTEGVIAPFEYSGRFSIPFPSGLGITGGKGEVWNSFGAWDQKWTASVIGPVNPRPGTVYRVSFDASRTGDKDSRLSGFLTSGGTRSSGTFKEFGGVTLVSAEPQRVTIAGVRNTTMTWAWDRTLGLRIYGEGCVTNLSLIEFIRPELSVSDTSAIDLGTVKPGQPSGVSAERRIVNSQTATVATGDTVWRTVLYGTAHVTAPADKPYLQAIDDVGVVLAGEQAALFELLGKNAMPDGQGIKFVGEDDQPGLQGGEKPESEPFKVRFRGNDKPGKYAAKVRIVTQAGNAGALSSGKGGEPLANLYYTDIPVMAEVKP